MVEQHIATGREAKLPHLRDTSAKVSPREVPSGSIGTIGSSAHELIVVELSRGDADIAQALLLPLGHTADIPFCDIDMSLLGKFAHSLGEGDILRLHEIAEGIPAFSATEAMPELRRSIDLERRGLLVMERTASPEFMATLLQGNTLGYQSH